MKLEQQLAQLAELGFSLNPGVTVEDLLYSWDRAAYEDQPFDLILFVLGSEVEREPWDRRFCSRVWNFDRECIEGTDAYVQIVRRLCDVAGQPNLITKLEDAVDLDSGDAWLKYEVDGVQRYWDIEVNDDWADGLTLTYVMSDIERDGQHFYAKDNGQAAIMFYLNDVAATRLNELAGGALQRSVVE